MTEPRNPYRPLEPTFLTDLFREPLDPGYAEAAQRRAASAAAGTPPPRWRRGMRAGTVVTLVVVGLLLAVAYRQVVADEPTRTQVRADLEDQIHQRQAETDRLAREAETLRDEVAQLRDRQISDPRLVRDLRELEAATGLGRVRGDGVVVEVADGPPGVDPKTGNPELDPQARILDRDLQQIANALWAAGAEAVAVNDRRLTASSTIRNASGAILVDRQPVAGPYRIAAIGPDRLRDQFAASPTADLLRLLVDEFGVTYQVRSAGGLTLPAASEPELHHATSIGGD
ncbi:MAG: DUF881 domain-containing protein [Micromonosporaceae bacterium]|nr:DUF881 domain-containing protein [Micromonosporaceae bacterium]